MPCCISPGAAPRAISPAPRQAGVAAQALASGMSACRRRSPRRSIAAGAAKIAVAPRPDEASLIASLEPARVDWRRAPIALFPAGGWANSSRNAHGRQARDAGSARRRATRRAQDAAPQEARGADHRSDRDRSAAGRSRRRRRSPMPLPPRAGAACAQAKTAAGGHATGADRRSLRRAALAAARRCWLHGAGPARALARPAVLPVATGDVPTDDERARGGAGHKPIDALGQRVGSSKPTIAKLPAGDAGVADRLAAADNAMKSLGVALAALSHRTDDTAANAGRAQARRCRGKSGGRTARGDEGRCHECHRPESRRPKSKRCKSASPRWSSRQDRARRHRQGILGRQCRAARLERGGAARRRVERRAVRGRTRRRSNRSAPTTRRLAPLAPFAATGVPSAQRWRTSSRADPGHAQDAGAQAPQGGFLERLQANAGKLVRIRPVNAPPGDDRRGAGAPRDRRGQGRHCRARSPISASSPTRRARRRRPGSTRRRRGRPRSRRRRNSPPTRRARSGQGGGAMIRVILFLLAVALIAAGVVWVADRPGRRRDHLDGLPHRDLGDGGRARRRRAGDRAHRCCGSIVRAILRSPEQVSLFFRHRRAMKGYLAISRGLIAIGAGDLRGARKAADEAAGCRPAIR